MIAVTALRLAEPGTLLVARPAGVPHLYAGPLTPSGRYVPRSARTVCRTHTRRLTVLPRGEVPANRRVCGSCAANLARTPRPSTRDGYRARFAHVALADLAAELGHATTARWVDTIAHLSLAVHGYTACNADVPGFGKSMNQLVGERRAVVSPEAHLARNERWRTQSENVRAADKEERAEMYRQAEARKERLGMNNAKPLKEPRR